MLSAMAIANLPWRRAWPRPAPAGTVVHLEQEGLAVAGADHHVGAAPAAAAERAVGGQRDALDLVLLGFGQPARAVVLHVVGEVLVLVVVGAFGRGDAHHRQRARVEPVAQHGAGHFLAFDEFLAQHVGVVLGRQRDGVLHLRIALDLGHADGRALARRLHDHGQAEHVGHGHDLLAALLVEGQAHVLGRRQAVGLPDALGHDLVHGHARSHHTRASVRNAQQFERALHGAVFAMAAMQRDEAACKAFALQLDQFAFGRIEGMRVDAARTQGFEHTGARHQ
jgi:hypothetical protein